MFSRSLTLVVIMFALALATAQAQMASTASEGTQNHWATSGECVNFYAANPNALAYTPAPPFHPKQLETGEEIRPLPADAEGCYLQPLRGGIQGWVIRLKGDPTVYMGPLPRRDARCGNTLMARVLFHTTPAAPAPAPATTNQQTTPDYRVLELELALELARMKNCSDPGKLLQQTQYDTRKKNTLVKVTYDASGCVAEVSNDNFKPAGSGFMSGLGRAFGTILTPPGAICDAYGCRMPEGYGFGYNTVFGGGRGHGGGGNRGGGGGGNNTTYGGGINTGGAH